MLLPFVLLVIDPFHLCRLKLHYSRIQYDTMQYDRRIVSYGIVFMHLATYAKPGG